MIIKIPLGMWDFETGIWYHNLLLKMTKEEQYQYNVMNGYL
jgi:hypothetical protein